MDIEEQEWTVSLPLTGAKWRGGDNQDIEETLSDELNANASELTAFTCAYTGGWSDDEQVEVLEMRFNDDHSVLDAKVHITFVEYRSSACKDHPHSEERSVELVLHMERDDNEATIGGSPSDPDQWDLLDRNSAYDGT